MDFLNEYHLAGLVIGICTFLIIGIFHPIVVKAEYYWGTKCWWIFLLLGIVGVIASLYTENILIAQGRRIKLNYPSTACLSSPHSIPLSVVLD